MEDKKGSIWKKKVCTTYLDFNFCADYEYDLEGNFELGVSFLATMLKEEDIYSKVGSRVDIKYEPQVLPRRLEEESSKRMLLPSSASVSSQWVIWAYLFVFWGVLNGKYEQINWVVISICPKTCKISLREWGSIWRSVWQSVQFLDTQ